MNAGARTDFTRPNKVSRQLCARFNFLPYFCKSCRVINGGLFDYPACFDLGHVLSITNLRTLSCMATVSWVLAYRLFTS